ncbi:helix-turn-helix domain-containing protein [Nocardia acidivorans]|uniref:helix-turn-helix domain-containing protein n=1 Tax=Nocardia acidivorans TaxID=404580 RepID=UPI00082F47E9|nr:helix-turn-helix domain-containing protein [Nocardia acidivorans]
MPVEPFRIAGAEVEIAVPVRSGGVPGVSMAGFRGRAMEWVDLQMVPYPALTLFIDLGDDLMLDEANGARTHGSSVVGFGTVGAHGGGRDIDLIQVRLSPVAAHSVLGVSSGLSGRVAPLDALWGRGVESLRERLHATRSWDERFAIIADLLTARERAGRAVDPEVAFAWRRIMLSHGGIRIDRLADETGWSRKRLWSRFRSQIGLTPKYGAQLVRFDCAAHRLAAGHSAARVSAECGYVDQSHFHRDVMAFTGLTPKALAVAPWLAVDPLAWAAPAYAPRT